jgi:peptide/nickel transport system ATP-binding protein
MTEATALVETADRFGGEPALVVDNLCVTTATGTPLLSEVSFEVPRGRSLAIVGESGSGKSLTVRAVLGLLPAGLSATGGIRIAGRTMEGPSDFADVRGQTVSLIMQDPFTLLNPTRRVGRQISDGFPRSRGRQADGEEVVRRLAEVGLAPEIADRYPHELSGGMRQRVGIAAALAADPEILVADEPTTALDVTTQREVLTLVKTIQAQRGMSFVLITHDLRVGFSMSDEVLVLYAGQMLERGVSSTVLDRQRHPYTRALLLAEPPVEHRVATLPSVPGRVPAHVDVVGRCAFAERCRWVQPNCVAHRPTLKPEAGQHSSSCIRIDEIADDIAATNAPVAGFDVTARTGAAPLVSVVGLSKRFSSTAQLALKSVDLEIRAGEAVGVVGESGSGKTTLARCLVGLETPDTGSIVVEGIDCSSYRGLSRRDLATVRSGIQMVFQDPFSTLNPARTVKATLAEALQAAGRSSSSGDVRELLDLVGLPDSVSTKRPSALSGGQLQRVAFARAVSRRPSILVCDESVSALDVSVQAQIIDLLAELRREMSMALLFITHDLAVVRQVTDHVYVLRNGECVEDGPTGRVLDQPQHTYTRALLASVPRSNASWLKEN